jgi:hypothetical protein
MKGTVLALLVLVQLAAPAWVQAQVQFLTYATNEGTITMTGCLGDTTYPGTFPAVTIPSNINGMAVTSIGDQAFYQVGYMSSVTIPDSVTSIGEAAFEESGLTNITIPSSVTGMGEYAFSECEVLTSATIANGVPFIPYNAFYGCGFLTSVEIPASVSSIGDYAFASCGLTNITIPGRGTSVGADAFSDCPGLTNVTIPSSVTYIGENAFTYCNNLTSVYFKGNAPDADTTAFGGVTIPATLSVYYFLGTTGWDGFFASTGLNAILWNPLGSSGHVSFGVRFNQFQFNFTGPANLVIVVEASTNLASPVWVPLQALTLTNGLLYFSDPQ